jgi:drug/metabolite transporter (DMT)-like permease
MTNPARTGLALLLGAAALSWAAICFRMAAPTHPLAASAIRLLIAGALLAPIALHAVWAGVLTRRVAARAAVAGLLYAVHFGAWVTSLTLTSVAASVTIVTATPLLLAVVGLVTGRDRPDRRLWAALALAVAGLSVLGGGHEGDIDALRGDALAGLGAAAMAGYLLLGRPLGADLPVLPYSAVAVAVGGMTLALACLLFAVPLRTASPSALGWLALAALVPQLVGHTILTWGLRRATPAQVGMSTVFEPVGSTLLAAWLLEEPLSLRIGLGCALTLTAVVVALARARPAPEAAPRSR